MSRARQLWALAEPTVRRCREHPFVRGLGDGSLAPERYRAFIAQDAYFLEAFARGYAHCLALAPDRDGLYAFRDLLAGVFDELQLHERTAAALSIDLAAVEPAPSTVAYTTFLVEAVGAEAAVGETLAAMTPCMRLYADIGARLAPVSQATNPYADWIATYAATEFQELAMLLESLLDRYATGSPREEQHYLRAMELELAFFQATWDSF